MTVYADNLTGIVPTEEPSAEHVMGVTEVLEASGDPPQPEPDPPPRPDGHVPWKQEPSTALSDCLPEIKRGDASIRHVKVDETGLSF